MKLGSYKCIASFLLISAVVMSSAAPALAAPPAVFSVVEGRKADASASPVLIVMGKFAADLRGKHRQAFFLNGTELVQAHVTTGYVVLELPPATVPGDADLIVKYGKTFGVNLPTLKIHLTLGQLLDGSVDLAKLSAPAQSNLSNAANLVSGTLDPQRFSAYADLLAEGKIGTASDDVAAGDHNHDSSYFTQTQLGDAGTVNSATNPVDWTKLKGVPAGFADGVDDNTTYANGTGLVLAGTTFSVDFAGTGSAATAAKSDHNHDSTYLKLSGGALTGTVTCSPAVVNTGAIQASGNFSGGIVSANNAGGGIGIKGTTSGTDGIGIFAETTGSNNSVAIECNTTGSGDLLRLYANKALGNRPVFEIDQNGTLEIEVTTTTAAVQVTHLTDGETAIEAVSTNGTAILADAKFGESIVAKLTSSASGNFLVCTSGGGTRARIDAAGRGYFNGGTQTSGADFAESVAVDRPKSEFEPGDVMVIDPTGERRFAKSSTAGSTAVAGVYSTKPGVLAAPYDVADEVKLADRERTEIPLAIVGIVPCKVCDEGGAIRAGDLLVTSSIPGHAMKAPANPAMGSVVGKALGALRSGKGVVEILVTAR